MINMRLEKIKYALESLKCQEIYLTDIWPFLKSVMCTQSVLRTAIKHNKCIFIKHTENPEKRLNPHLWDYF